ncbi:MAG: hypothetical protein ABS70_00925 [Nitrospira sp. SCN 59-13]|nr:MAG: hypothetical protein ABS70_00925 [Nitrospira sp. SCN 59-13]
MFFSRSALTSSALFLFCLSIFTLPTIPSFASTTIYSYTNDEGVQTFTNELESVPEKYRQQLTHRSFDTPPAPETPAPAVAPEARTRSADVRTITASAEYRMSDHDNRTDAVRLATEAAKQDALEQVATYVERITEVKDLNVTRDDIRSFTAGVVKVIDQKVSTRLVQDQVVIRVDITGEVEPQDVIHAIAALRENDQARQELLALRVETDRLQAQVDDTNRALAAAATPAEAQQYTDQRQDMLDQMQANALLSQAWTSWTYPTLGFYSYPWFGVSGINGLLLQAQRLSPHHRHLPLAQRTITANHSAPSAQPPVSTLAHPSLLVPPLPHANQYQAPPLLNSQGQQAKVGDVVVIPTPRSIPPTPQYSPQAPSYQVHPNHFWRPTPPNIQSLPSPSQHRPSVSMAPPSAGGHAGHSGGGHSHGGGHHGR